jgi:cytochrome oxidase Cu insertion factor (SCO1/SenC/PrrC family)
MKDNLLGICVLMALLLLAPAVGAKPDFASMGIAPYDPPKTAPVLALPDLQGKTVRLADLKGKVVLVFFWATW